MKIISKNEVVALTEEGIKEDIRELEEDILPSLRTGQKMRLFLAEIKYPLEEKEFDESEPELIRAFAIMKRLKDSMVALGVEVVIDQLLNNKQGEENGDETTKEE